MTYKTTGIMMMLHVGLRQLESYRRSLMPHAPDESQTHKDKATRHHEDIPEQGKSKHSSPPTQRLQVAPEQGWDQETTLEHLVAKGGYQGGFKSVRECFKLIRRYQSLKFGMKYEEFLDL